MTTPEYILADATAPDRVFYFGPTTGADHSVDVTDQPFAAKAWPSAMDAGHAALSLPGRWLVRNVADIPPRKP